MDSPQVLIQDFQAFRVDGLMDVATRAKKCSFSQTEDVKQTRAYFIYKIEPFKDSRTKVQQYR